jgi:DNA (cytosine-5)-methyltransferase 1
MKVLNLYAGIGGNRKLWTDCEVTAVELDPQIADIYKERFTNDKMIVGDAHEYLLYHYKEFDFIWSSPPCPTHSKIRFCNKYAEPVYPDMKLYQEILFLNHNFNGKWVVENVVPYYEPLIPGKLIGRHLIWSNIKIQQLPKTKRPNIENTSANSEVYGFNLRGRTLNQRKDKILRNQVDPELGLHIFNAAKGIITKPKGNQTQIEF